jgi:hypothetical protein
LHQTGRLTQERLSTLFPTEEINFVLALAQIFREIPGAGVAQAVLGLFNDHLQQWWTLFRHRRAVDRTMLEEIQSMDPERDLVPEMPRLFALDLNAALAADGALPRIVLLFDGHDAFATIRGASTPKGDRDRWLRYLLAALDLEGGIVPVVTSRREPRWADQAHYPIPTEYLDPIGVGHFSDADANAYLEKAGVDDPVLRARLCDYARVAPDEVHPLYAGLGADVVLQATRRERHLAPEDFPEEPDAANNRETGSTPLILSAFYLQSAAFSKWAMLDLNQRPPPCKFAKVRSRPSLCVRQIGLSMGFSACRKQSGVRCVLARTGRVAVRLQYMLGCQLLLGMRFTTSVREPVEKASGAFLLLRSSKPVYQYT